MSIVDHSVSRALTGDEYPVERDRLELEFVDVERDGMSDQLFAAPFDDETILLDRDDVLGPLVNERHVEPRMGKHATNISANSACPDDFRFSQKTCLCRHSRCPPSSIQR